MEENEKDGADRRPFISPKSGTNDMRHAKCMGICNRLTWMDRQEKNVVDEEILTTDYAEYTDWGWGLWEPLVAACSQ